jgi:hypothetical protein
MTVLRSLLAKQSFTDQVPLLIGLEEFKGFDEVQIAFVIVRFAAWIPREWVRANRPEWHPVEGLVVADHKPWAISRLRDRIGKVSAVGWRPESGVIRRAWFPVS